MESTYCLNQLAPDIEAGEIKLWHVTPGMIIEEGALLLEMEFTKVNIQLLSPIAGKIKQCLVKPGDFIEKDTPLIQMQGI